jgi:formylglycine-generating enzyme required for sulfatase activity
MPNTRKGRRLALLLGAVVVIAIVVATWLSVPHIQFLWLFESLGRNEQGYEEYRHRRTGVVFVRVAGGTFWMGSPEHEEGSRPNEHPRHAVKLSPFLLSKYEISQSQWDSIAGSNSSRFGGDDLPVENVSWDDCQEFCGMTGLRLPTEAQWEYACRAGTYSVFAFGAAARHDLANFGLPGLRGDPREKGIRWKTVSVTSFGPNQFGLYNMHGNIWEWCQDVYDEHLYSKPGATGRDPVCTAGSDFRVLRGGDWHCDSIHMRSAYRHAELRSRRKPAGQRAMSISFRPPEFATDGTFGIRPAFYPLP